MPRHQYLIKKEMSSDIKRTMNFAAVIVLSVFHSTRRDRRSYTLIEEARRLNPVSGPTSRKIV